VDKIRPHVPPPGQNRSAQDKTQRRTPKKGAAKDARREPVAVVSNVRANIRISVDELPEGKVDL